MSLLGIDVGTTGCKAVAFTPEGRVLASAYAEYPLHSPRPGWQELDPAVVWDAIAGVLRGTATQVRTAGDPVIVLAVSAQGEALIPADVALRPLGPSIVTFDGRADADARGLAARLGGDTIYQITGMLPHAMHSASKLAWVRREWPDVWRRAVWWLGWEDYVGARLGADPAVSRSLAARTMLLDVRQGEWWPRILEALDLDAGRLARAVAPGTAIGRVSRAAARETGLPPGALIVAGGHDQACGALGAGAVETGVAADATGTVECLIPTLSHLALNDTMRAANLCCCPHVIPDRWTTFAFTFGAGSVLRWMRDMLAPDLATAARAGGRDPYEALLAEMPGEPTALLALPHLAGAGTPSLDLGSRGAILGLTLSTSRGEVVKALLEGITLEMALNLELLRAAGLNIATVHAIGGAARSDAWLQLKADIFGLPVVAFDQPEGAAWGAALLAGLGAGVYDDVRDGLVHAPRPRARFAPDARRSATYRRRLADYRGLHARVAAAWDGDREGCGT